MIFFFIHIVQALLEGACELFNFQWLLHSNCCAYDNKEFEPELEMNANASLCLLDVSVVFTVSKKSINPRLWFQVYTLLCVVIK